MKWVHLFLADVVWECAQILLAFALTLTFYAIYPFPAFGPPVRMPNLGLLVATFGTATTLGIGYGMIWITAISRWHGIDSVAEVLRWVLFITSGVYHSYATLPWFVGRYAWYQPMVAPLEYTRHALDPSYPISNLSLVYSAIFALGLLFIGFAYRNCERGTLPR